ncbi:MAG: efflux RND transporter periplasmic adaptor subunit [Cyclobacteriaceae bacterium]
MKKNLRNNWGMYLVVFLVTLTSCGHDGDHAENTDTYTCPMHPTVVSDRPGPCPVCGMDLVRKARAGEEVEITEDLSKLLNSPNETVVGSIRTIKGEYKSVPVSLQAHGVVTYDTRNIYTIPARVGGRLEKIYLKYAFQPVTKGQRIAEVYSAELITAQRELLFLLENDSDNESLINGAKRKLELLGLSNSQINDLIKRKETTNTFSVYSPYSGYLITDTQTAPFTSIGMPSAQSSASGGMKDGMGSTSSATSPTPSSSESSPVGTIVREGDYVTAGQTLFSVVNSTSLRIELDLPAPYSGIVKEGTKVQLNFGDDNDVEALVDFVQPFFTEGQDFLKLRVYTNETVGLHIGHLVNAKINLESTEALWVPKEAVLDLGLQKVVFKKERGVFKPKLVTTGVSAEGMIEIRRGLTSSEEIAANAQYLVDSESFIKPVN